MIENFKLDIPKEQWNNIYTHAITQKRKAAFKEMEMEFERFMVLHTRPRPKYIPIWLYYWLLSKVLCLSEFTTKPKELEQ
jgi:hypothetical protein